MCWQILTGCLQLLLTHVVSNNVFSYLAIHYGLVDDAVAQRNIQKRSADLFEAYIGACDLESDDPVNCFNLTAFLRQLFRAEVWPALAHIVQLNQSATIHAPSASKSNAGPSSSMSASGRLTPETIAYLAYCWPGIRISTRGVDVDRDRGCPNAPETRIKTIASTLTRKQRKLERKEALSRKLLNRAKHDRPVKRARIRLENLKELRRLRNQSTLEGVEIIDLVSDDDWLEDSEDGRMVNDLLTTEMIDLVSDTD